MSESKLAGVGDDSDIPGDWREIVAEPPKPGSTTAPEPENLSATAGRPQRTASRPDILPACRQAAGVHERMDRRGHISDCPQRPY